MSAFIIGSSLKSYRLPYASRTVRIIHNHALRSRAMIHSGSKNTRGTTITRMTPRMTYLQIPKIDKQRWPRFMMLWSAESIPRAE